MKLKAIFHDAFLFLGIVIEGLLLLQTHIFMEKGKFGYMLVTGSLAIVPIAIVIWVMRRKKTQENQRETQGIASFQRYYFESGFKQLRNM